MNQPTNDMPQMPEEESPRRTGGRYLKKKKRSRVLRVLLIVLCVLIGFVLVAGATYFILYKIGEKSMLRYDDVVMEFPQPSETEDDDAPERILTYDDGKTVTYGGHTYTRNENITTLLFIGVDKTELVENELYGNGGEADCVLLIAIDTETGKTRIVNVSREAYAPVDIYSANGTLLESRNTQLCRAYAYGDGREQSCENLLKSASRLFYGIPIHSYIALDMRAVSAANDLIGGVTLTAINDVPMLDGSTLYTGEEITLMGSDAERYVRYRNKTQLDSNEKRMDRQKQYVQEFASIVIQRSKGDITTPISLYNCLSDYTVTNLTLSDATFLITRFLQTGASFDFSTIRGTTDKLGANAICYLDETDVYETILRVFYTQTD